MQITLTVGDDDTTVLFPKSVRQRIRELRDAMPVLGLAIVLCTPEEGDVE